MNFKRIIPFFLLKGTRLVKGTNFQDFIDVGDPISQGMIYDAQGADEIAIVDIEASKNGKVIAPEIIRGLITKCRLPLAAGGGIKSVEDAKSCFNAGADKIIVNSHAVLNPDLVRKLSNEFGAQSVLVSVDVKRNEEDPLKYDIWIFSGKEKADVSLENYLKTVIEKGAGEIILTCIEREGSLTGFEKNLYQRVGDIVSVPLIASGGSGCYDDMVELFQQTSCDACALGKMLFLRDYDIVRIKAYLHGKKVAVREA